MVEDRIRSALREIAEAAAVPVKENARWHKPSTRSERRWPVAALAGVAVAAIVAVVALMPGVWSTGLPVAASDRPSLPEQFPPYSFAQGTLDGPFGRAIALYTNGTGHEDWTFSQVIVAGADRNSYRRVPLPKYPNNMGNVAALLSPDGTKVVAGDPHGVITVIDLMMGGSRRYPTGYSIRTAPLAVSPDGGRVAFVAFAEHVQEGTLYLLDLGSGEVSPALGTMVEHVAFSPDGALAYQMGRTIHIRDRDGAAERQIMLASEAVLLAGPHAWTPDGRFLLTIVTGPGRLDGNIIYSGDRTYVFVAADGSGSPVPQAIPGNDLMPMSWGPPILGWRSPTTMLVSTGDVDGTTSNLIVEVDISGSGHRVISRFRVGPRDDLAVGDVQLATGLLAGATMRSGAGPDRGPWPTWAVVTLALCFAPMAVTVLVGHLRRRHEP